MSWALAIEILVGSGIYLVGFVLGRRNGYREGQRWALDERTRLRLSEDDLRVELSDLRRHAFGRRLR